ncbi:MULTISPECIES: hypothetical protein [unclassified Leisingera]|uniref:hypothetical protein n=1 Tax=unclassified Leisingera TaxID=2614906 RepID=UPI00101345D7|nr:MULTISPECIES: hypothetical protein [unclassified Leisingera]MBQ4825191.1 hypothetical protein [Leisingera sp. HS039]MCF6430213.1 hypothetical protein [Leisingera sp. MMG026]QAX28262.1 hypothetical protein ETW24_01975 [Leisingera sp. NJS204]QBR35037.1 hypothetical protein ETW23_01525 [Leisingera sp. NJS201]
MNEAYFISLLCGALFGGQPETVHKFTYPGGAASIRTDCENSNRVIEFGLDKRSSLDSIQQALFAAEITGKEPVVVLIDTDSRMGRFEWRIARAANIADVPIRIVPAALTKGDGAGG